MFLNGNRSDRLSLFPRSEIDMQMMTRIFLLPGDSVSQLLGAEDHDDRAMIRTMINMLFWNAVIIIGAFIIGF